MPHLKEPQVGEVERVVGVVEDDEVRRVEDEEEGAGKVEGAGREDGEETVEGRGIPYMTFALKLGHTSNERGKCTG